MTKVPGGVQPPSNIGQGGAKNSANPARHATGAQEGEVENAWAEQQSVAALKALHDKLEAERASAQQRSAEELATARHIALHDPKIAEERAANHLLFQLLSTMKNEPNGTDRAYAEAQRLLHEVDTTLGDSTHVHGYDQRVINAIIDQRRALAKEGKLFGDGTDRAKRTADGSLHPDAYIDISRLPGYSAPAQGGYAVAHQPASSSFAGDIAAGRAGNHPGRRPGE